MTCTVPALVGLLAAAGTLAADPEGVATALGNATYQGIHGESITLTGGRFASEPLAPGGASRQRVTLAEGLIARADLNGDGREEAAVILVESSGGTGSFVYLAVMSLSGGKAKNLGTIELGDRVQIRHLTAAPGAIAVETVVAGEEDAAAQPAEKVRRTFALGPEGLTETGNDLQGALSLADLDGTAWRLRAIQSAGSKIAPETPVTLTLEGTRIAGHAGCNRYFAEVTDEGRGGLSLGPVGSTRMACPDPLMAVEQDYLERLAQVEWFAFGMGDLILGTAQGVLLFDAKTP